MLELSNHGAHRRHASMKVPALRRGNAVQNVFAVGLLYASMKVPALRRGNLGLLSLVLNSIMPQ